MSERLYADYDPAADVLYVLSGAPRDAYSDEMLEGVYIRRDEATDTPIGVTVDGFCEMWKDRESELFRHLAEFLSVDAEAIRAAISEATRKPIH